MGAGVGNSGLSTQALLHKGLHKVDMRGDVQFPLDRTRQIFFPYYQTDLRDASALPRLVKNKKYFCVVSLCGWPIQLSGKPLVCRYKFIGCKVGWGTRIRT